MNDNLLAKRKKELTTEQYTVCFLKGTEAPYSGKYDKHYQQGIYKCVVCSKPLFKSQTKFDSGSGWPSFFDTFHTDSIKKIVDSSHGMERTEVVCASCGSHLGHVFSDGPTRASDGSKATGLRYCINSLSLEFEAKK